MVDAVRTVPVPPSGLWSRKETCVKSNEVLEISMDKDYRLWYKIFLKITSGIMPLD